MKLAEDELERLAIEMLPEEDLEKFWVKGVTIQSGVAMIILSIVRIIGNLISAAANFYIRSCFSVYTQSIKFTATLPIYAAVIAISVAIPATALCVMFKKIKRIMPMDALNAKG